MNDINSKQNRRIGEENISNQGCLMKIIKYYQYNDIIVEFQDEYRANVHTAYNNFLNGGVKNPYHRSVFGVGMIGNKYASRINGKQTKEYITWNNMLKRCFDKEYKEKHPTYKDVTCCKEWLLFDNFYEWLHEQENFDKWLGNKGWDLDKDILIKDNKIYSPNTCCLVPNSVNKLFAKCIKTDSKYPVGINKRKGRFEVSCNNPFTNKQDYLGIYFEEGDAIIAYKTHKENLIKMVAIDELTKKNITEKCYNAMMNYKI